MSTHFFYLQFLKWYFSFNNYVYLICIINFIIYNFVRFLSKFLKNLYKYKFLINKENVKIINLYSSAVHSYKGKANFFGTIILFGNIIYGLNLI